MDPKKLPIAVLMTLGLGDGCIFKPCLSIAVLDSDSSPDDSGADDSSADDSATDDSGADDSATDDSATEARSAAADREAATQRVLARGALPPDVAAALAQEPKE